MVRHSASSHIVSNLWRFLPFCVALVAAVTTGCAFTTMQTPRQLEADEVVVSASVDVPGGLDDYEPYFSWTEARLGTTRLAAQGMYGIGDRGDVGLHVGTTRHSFNAGFSGRYYLSDWLTAGWQTDYLHRLDLVTTTPRITTATDAERWYYSGLQTNLMFGNEDREQWMEFLGGTAGVVAGLEYVTDNWRLPVGFQAEAILSPVYFGHGNGLFAVDEGTPGIYQIGIGASVRF